MQLNLIFFNRKMIYTSIKKKKIHYFMWPELELEILYKIASQSNYIYYTMQYAMAKKIK
jgi:hypothetical protein